MAIANPRQRNAESAIVHREKVVKQTSTGQRKLNPKNAPEDKMWMGGVEKPPITSADTGASSKFGSKSPLVTTMGSTRGKAF